MPDTIKLTTPDHIELEFQLAGVGTRFAAVLFDHLLQMLLMIVAWIGMLRVGVNEITYTVTVLLLFLIPWFYFVLFEWLWNGQTPGKKLGRIRVMRDDGRPLDFAGAALRNILRIADFLPISYGFGVIAIFFSPHLKRLGDLAAGTVVVVEHAVARQPQRQPPRLQQPAGTVPLVGLAKEDREAAMRFLERRYQLQPDVRMRLGRQIAEALAPKAGYTAEQVLQDHEAFLELVVRSE